ncbi:TIGR03085 family metal-binding protein [Brachybacterium hainanense]|uniref:TIGR03085 family metal-binding protein n=1 Tax=Brachybacterium hainanense TaxID=1541174 RepID=A0ABV6RCS0_9MICO
MDSAASAPAARMPFVRREREALADSLLSFGPDAPTILDGWTGTELLDHLIHRELVLPAAAAARSPLAPLRLRGRASLAALEEMTWSQKVALFRAGHGRFSPLRLADPVMNTIEYLVHHEDLRRARPGWAPRELATADERTVWTQLSLGARLLIRASVDLTLVSPIGGLRVPARSAAAESPVRVHGSVTELLLWAYGRDRVARVRLDGESAALLVLREANRGV